MKFGLSDSVISEIQEVFRRHPNIKKVVIFGSRAKGNYRDGSDIALAAFGNNLDYNQLLSILIEIDDLGILYHVDLLDYQKHANTPIGEHIDRVGQIFYLSA
jgi:predicted nucleotidyltransferase